MTFEEYYESMSDMYPKEMCQVMGITMERFEEAMKNDTIMDVCQESYQKQYTWQKNHSVL